MISFHEGNLIGPIEKFFHEADEIILIANLPYLSEIIYTSADDDVKRYEPRRALLSAVTDSIITANFSLRSKKFFLRFRHITCVCSAKSARSRIRSSHNSSTIHSRKDVPRYSLISPAEAGFFLSSQDE
jgi:methylase of polypeptide subunit release factors